MTHDGWEFGTFRLAGGATTYGRFTCDAYHGGLEPPLATVDWGRRIQCVGIPGKVRFLCDKHARGLYGWRDKARMAGAPALTSPNAT